MNSQIPRQLSQCSGSLSLDANGKNYISNHLEEKQKDTLFPVDGTNSGTANKSKEKSLESRLQT